MGRLVRRRLESNFKTHDSTEMGVLGQFLSVLVAYFEASCFSILRRA